MNKVKQYIESQEGDFFTKSNAVLDTEISEAEHTLGFTFDLAYGDYVSSFGIIAYESVELLGLGVPKDSYLNVCQATIDVRNSLENYPDNSVVLETIGEKNWVIYTMHSGVFQLSPSGLSLIDSDLENFLLTRLVEA